MRKKNGKGGYTSSWIRPTTRLAVYLRDGLCCVYCGIDWSRSEGLTIDHVTPRSRGGSNEPANLVTACRRCNRLRQFIHEKYKDEWDALRTILMIRSDLFKKVQVHTKIPLSTFRSTAVRLENDRPAWLEELKRMSLMTPKEQRELSEEPDELRDYELHQQMQDEEIPF